MERRISIVFLLLSNIAILVLSGVLFSEARANKMATPPREDELVGRYFGYDNSGSGYFYYLDLKGDGGGTCAGLLNGKFSGIYSIGKWRIKEYELILTTHAITRASALVDLSTTYAFHSDIGLNVKSPSDNKVRNLILRRESEMLKLLSLAMTYVENHPNAPIPKPPGGANGARLGGAWFGLDMSALNFYRLVLDENGTGTLVSLTRVQGYYGEVDGAYMIDEWTTRDNGLSLRFHRLKESSPSIEIKASYADDNTVGLQAEFPEYPGVRKIAVLRRESDLFVHLSECKKLIEQTTAKKSIDRMPIDK